MQNVELKVWHICFFKFLQIYIILFSNCSEGGMYGSNASLRDIGSSTVNGSLV